MTDGKRQEIPTMGLQFPPRDGDDSTDGEAIDGDAVEVVRRAKADKPDELNALVLDDGTGTEHLCLYEQYEAGRDGEWIAAGSHIELGNVR